MDGYIEISALGRECYLGQLYDARSSTLLYGFSLYNSDVIKPRTTNVNGTKIKYDEVKSFSDRAKTLEVSAELSVAIMGGAITVHGQGSYLNGSQDTDESTTVAIVSRHRLSSQSLDLAQLKSETPMDQSALAKTRATHFVTSITFGANVIGTLTQKSSNKSDSTAIKGNFSIQALKDLGKAFSAEGKADVSSDQKEKLLNSGINVDFMADVKLGDHGVPTDPVAMLELVRISSSLIGTGVACEVQLAPLATLYSGIPTFRELAKADLDDIIKVYDKVLKLGGNRDALSADVEKYSELFPTFAAGITARSASVQKLVQQARDKLRVYLEEYRSASAEGVEGGHVENPARFTAAIDQVFTKALSEYEADKADWRRYQDRLAAAEQHGFPVIGISAIGGKMNRADKGMLAAILVPDNAKWEALMNLYGDIAVDIRQWRSSVDKAPDNGSEGSLTEYVTIFADQSYDAALYDLDDKAGTLKNALKSSRGSGDAVFLTYGRSRSHLGGFVWNVLDKEGWGVIVDKTQNWRYVGDVEHSQPHGSGIMAYANKTKYEGHFARGERDGKGKVLDHEGKEIPGMGGVFVKNVPQPQGVVVEVTVENKDSVPIQYGEVALNKLDAVGAHVDHIGTVMGWKETQRFRLVLDEGENKVDVVGNAIDSSDSSNVGTTVWPLGDAPKIKARVL